MRGDGVIGAAQGGGPMPASALEDQDLAEAVGQAAAAPADRKSVV